MTCSNLSCCPFTHQVGNALFGKECGSIRKRACLSQVDDGQIARGVSCSQQLLARGEGQRGHTCFMQLSLHIRMQSEMTLQALEMATLAKSLPYDRAASMHMPGIRPTSERFMQG